MDDNKDKLKSVNEVTDHLSQVIANEFGIPEKILKGCNYEEQYKSFILNNRIVITL